MFYLIFGFVWMAATSYMIYQIYTPNYNATYEINNEIVTYEEFTQDIWLKIFLGAVLLIGLIIFLVGLRMIIRNYLTSKHGKKGIGFCVRMEPNGQTINERPVYDAIFLVFEEDRTCNLYRENIGTNDEKYLPGRFYDVLYHNKDINVISRLDNSKIPMDKIEIINNEIKKLQY